jgi:hypothetical protein
MISPYSAEEFLARLQEIAAGRKRILALDYRQVFTEMSPTLSPPDARAKLAGWLSLLAETDEIRLPKGKGLYDRSNSGDLPAWVEFVRPEESREPLPIDPESFAWAPELRFACRIRDARQLRVLLRVQQFLSEGGRLRPLVPVKERSIELFGKEKRLDMLRNSALFQSGSLSLELLRCFSVPPPLIWESLIISEPRPVLVVENHSTYHSFTRWNREMHFYAAIVYGNGDAFKAGAAGVGEVVRSMLWDGRLLYFGDIDPEGLLIPLAASAALTTIELPALVPHYGCYRRLFNRASVAPLPSGAKLRFAQESRIWVGEDLAADVESWFDRGIRLPQELVGWEELARDGTTFASV